MRTTTSSPQASDPTGLAPVARGFLHYLSIAPNPRVSSAKTREPPTRGTRGRWGRLCEVSRGFASDHRRHGECRVRPGTTWVFVLIPSEDARQVVRPAIAAEVEAVAPAGSS